MFEKLIEQLIKELGATGVLILGLYWILYKPTKAQLKETADINKKLDRICNLLTNVEVSYKIKGERDRYPK